jgi:hypothetical protein
MILDSCLQLLLLVRKVLFVVVVVLVIALVVVVVVFVACFAPSLLAVPLLKVAAAARGGKAK